MEGKEHESCVTTGMLMSRQVWLAYGYLKIIYTPGASDLGRGRAWSPPHQHPRGGAGPFRYILPLLVSLTWHYYRQLPWEGVANHAATVPPNTGDRNGHQRWTRDRIAAQWKMATVVGLGGHFDVERPYIWPTRIILNKSTKAVYTYARWAFRVYSPHRIV